MFTSFFVAYSSQTVYNHQHSFSENFQQKNIEQTYAGVFWINFVIAAIGTYSIYGIGAGIVAVGVTYFVVNGNKIAMKKAIWGCVLGMFLGGLIRLLTLL